MKKIAMLRVTPESQGLLTNYAQRCGFNISKDYNGNAITEFDFHLTLAASQNTDVYLANGVSELDSYIEAKPVRLSILGKYPVFECVDLSTRMLSLRLMLQMQGNLIPTFPDFKPHVSLSYSWDGEPALSSCPKPGFNIVFDRVEVKDFVEKSTFEKLKESFRKYISF